ncbi:MAG: glycosyltransferase family 4 protein, partial [Candidatus Riflebacteria bacterium]|nr:glycosyltransferase family 4 protein [Candidatus Riflebacteria bacterium]
HIHFCGISKELEKIYSDLDLLVLCSKNEGTPVVIIEALAAGCPVAAVDVGGVREVLENGKTGRLLPSEPELFTKYLANAIFDLKEGKFKEYPDLKTRQSVAKAYSVDNLVRNIYNLYSGK